MNEKKRRNLRALRPAVFLLPAAAIVVLVMILLPLTAPDLRDIPERLSPKPLVIEAAPEEEEKTDAFFDYEDGEYTGSAYGFGGMIELKVTVEDGYISVIQILNAPGETEPYFTLAKTVLDSVYREQTWEVDAVSGATFSSKGILAAIKNAITGETVETERPVQMVPETVDSEEFDEPAGYKDGSYTGTARGFGGEITVEVVIRNGQIAEILILDASGETADYLARASTVISSILSSGSPNVDTVSGATYSSGGIITAVKRALMKAGGDPAAEVLTEEEPEKTVEWEAPAAPEVLVEVSSPDRQIWKDGIYTGIGEGFGGEIEAEVKIRDGSIVRIKILRAEDETPEFLKQAKTLRKEIIRKQSTDVDVVSGATYSSRGIIQAVKAALKKARKKGGKADPEDAEKEKPSWEEAEEEKPSGEEPEKEKPSGEEEASEEDETRRPDKKLTDGTFTGTGEGFGGEIEVEVTISDGRITGIRILSAEAETPRYFNKAKSLTDLILKKQSTDVDAVSGATFSSAGILEAVAGALKAAEKLASEEETQPTKEPSAPEEPSESETPGTPEEPVIPGDTDPPETPGDTDPPESKYADGVYTGTALCEDTVASGFYYTAVATVTVQDGVIREIVFDVTEDLSEYPEDNLPYINYAAEGRTRRGIFYPGIRSQVTESQQAEKVDVVSGATFSSNAFIEAIRQALAEAEEAGKKEDETILPAQEEPVLMKQEQCCGEEETE